MNDANKELLTKALKNIGGKPFWVPSCGIEGDCPAIKGGLIKGLNQEPYCEPKERNCDPFKYWDPINNSEDAFELNVYLLEKYGPEEYGRLYAEELANVSDAGSNAAKFRLVVTNMAAKQ